MRCALIIRCLAIVSGLSICGSSCNKRGNDTSKTAEGRYAGTTRYSSSYANFDTGGHPFRIDTSWSQNDTVRVSMLSGDSLSIAFYTDHGYSPLLTYRGPRNDSNQYSVSVGSHMHTMFVIRPAIDSLSISYSSYSGINAQQFSQTDIVFGGKK